jgi:hypothetical protein
MLHKFKILLSIFIIVISTNLFSQIDDYVIEERSCITIGILKGGGSILGADMEFLISDRFGAQVGFGLVGFGGGLNYHFEPSIRSSFVSLQYWNQGTGVSFAQNLIGPSFVHRSSKWFTAQIGLGYVISQTPAFQRLFDTNTPVIFTYSIGVYLPM